MHERRRRTLCTPGAHLFASLSLKRYLIILFLRVLPIQIAMTAMSVPRRLIGP